MFTNSEGINGYCLVNYLQCRGVQGFLAIEDDKKNPERLAPEGNKCLVILLRKSRDREKIRKEEENIIDKETIKEGSCR
jgi:hypothetical protein